MDAPCGPTRAAPPARGLLGGLLLVALGALGPPGPRPAGASTEARTPAEVYERRGAIADCLVYVAGNLKTRVEADPAVGTAQLLLVLDPTASLKDEIEALAAALEEAWDAGPRGMGIGVYGAGAGEYTPPTRIPSTVEGALAALAFLPANGPKNLHEAVREAAARFAKEAPGARALLLVTEEGGEAEDDVELTRRALFDAGAAFYCIAPEAGLERPWTLTFEAREVPERGLTERFHPEPRKRPRGELFYGGDVALGLVPYGWEFDLAQADFVWVRPPRYPVPSGFGYWNLATLCHSSGGRYFVYDFSAPAAGRVRNAQRTTLYDYSRLALLAPDLRPRPRILKDLAKDWRALAIVRIWEHLANEAVPVVQTLGHLERKGSGLALRPARPVRSTAPPPTWFADLDEVRKGQRFFQDRAAAVEQALKWWEGANARERTEKPGEDPLKERVEADFQLLGVQLRKVDFHLKEALAALATIEPLDVTYRRARIVPRPLAAGVRLPERAIDLGDETRNARLAEVLLGAGRVAERYAGTPWALVLQKGWMVTFAKDVQVIEPEREVRRPRPDPKGEGSGAEPAAPAPPPAPPPPPPPGPKPGSGSGGPTTGN